MDIVSIGGGPAGLYFSILMKLRDARHRVRVIERNGADDTFGWGVVFSDETLGNLETADPETYREITESFAHWDAIDIHYQGEVLTSRGHGFSGLSRRRLLNILQARAQALGVEIEYRREVASTRDFPGADLILAADGANSVLRQAYADAFQPELDWRPNKFIWLGTTRRFDAFTFYFKADAHGLWRVHAYRFDDQHSTFIVETTAETWTRAGLDRADEDQSVRFLEALFAPELQGHPLLKNKAVWRNFPTVRNRRWSHENIVLLGDAAHTAHFSVGSGTKLAMEDSIALAEALSTYKTVPSALAAYEAERRPQVESLQRAAQASLEWFESAERYHGHVEPIEFAASLLTRSLRITHENLKVRDPEFVQRIDSWFARKSANQSGVNVPAEPPPPPMFTPFRLRDLVLENRVVVSPMCQYSA
ncbi:MAG: FAD-dependent monooxygenase, partial [Stellaceae bacterium]